MDIKKETEKYILTWSNQGRSEDQIWAVRNFMTGQGLLMLNDLKEGLIKEIIGKIGVMDFNSEQRSSDLECSQEGYEYGLEDAIKIVNSLKGEKGSK